MPYWRHTPAQPLSQYVACFWYWEDAPQTPAKERLLPTGEASIILNLRDDPIRIYDLCDLDRSETYSTALVSGACTEPFVIDNRQQDRVFGIQFAPGGAFPFLGLPSCQIADRALPLETLWRSRSAEMRERLLAAPRVESMFHIAEAMLLTQIGRALHRAIPFSLGHFCRVPHTQTVARVSDRLGLSQRRFIELFREQVGLTPKAFCRVRRFQHVLQAIHGAPWVNWTEVALESGYYDQAHFIHDFRSFSGLTPSQYWEGRTAHLNHVPIVQ